jgi:hypothetical protein
MWVHVIDQNICSEVLGKTKVFYCLRPVYQQSVLLPEVCVPNILRYWERPKCSIAWGLCTKHSEVLGKTKVFYCLRPVYQQSVLLPEACVPNILRYWERPKCSIACVPTKCSIAWGLCTKQSVLLPEACVPNNIGTNIFHLHKEAVFIYPGSLSVVSSLCFLNVVHVVPSLDACNSQFLKADLKINSNTNVLILKNFIKQTYS